VVVLRIADICWRLTVWKGVPAGKFRLDSEST